MTTEPIAFSNDDLPALFQSADLCSFKGRRRRRFFFVGFLVCDLIAATCASIESHPIWISLSCVIFLALGLLGTVLLLQESPEKSWYGGRALAESVKTLAWRYMMCAEPFVHGLPDTEADRTLVRELRALLNVDQNLIGGLELQDPRGQQITRKMRMVRDLGVADRKAIYLRFRLRDQKQWYANKGKWARKWLGRCRWALFIVQLGLVLDALSAIVWPHQYFAPVGALSTLAASVVAWQQLNEFGGLAAAYNLAAHELTGLEIVLELANTDRELEEFVLNAERAVSREHTLWRARRTENA